MSYSPRMRVTVTQLSDGTPESEWEGLREHVAQNRSELVLLGEMPFASWLPAHDQVDPEAWQDAVYQHDAWIARLGELGAATVASSRPVNRNNIPYNEGFLWSAASGYRTAHTKYYLPNERGFWEASWYRRAESKAFQAVQFDGGTAGFMICTDMWFAEHARGYAQQGADMILVPRATEGSTSAKWLAGGRAVAVMAGAFCVSSNRRGLTEGVMFGGTGWIIDPEGNVLVTTSDREPFATHDINLLEARGAKSTYPRYVAD